MKSREIEYSNLLLKMSNEILNYIKKYGLESFDNYKKNKDIQNEETNFVVEEFTNIDNDKVKIVSSQKENKNILPLLICGWILYKILK